MKKHLKNTPHEKRLATQRELLRAAVSAAGGQTQVAADLGVTQAAVSKWCVQGFVPLRRAQTFEALYGAPRNSIIDPRIAHLLAPAEFAAE